MVPADTTDSMPIAGRPSSCSYSPTCTHSSLGRASQPKPQTPQHRPPPPASVPAAYYRHRAPEQPAEAARRYLEAECVSAGSTQCLLAGATWCQRWQPALTTCVHAPAPPETPLSARSERTVAAAAGTGRRPLARSRAGKTHLGWLWRKWDVRMGDGDSRFDFFLAKFSLTRA